MSAKTMTNSPRLSFEFVPSKHKRVQSIDLLRGTVMIIMALDHVRDYFHDDAFMYSPTDLSQTNPFLFFTRWITHFCAPIFVFLAGISAFLYGQRRSKKELSFFLLTRGLWLVFAELSILSLFRTFNPAFHYFNLQVIWAIGISMIILSAMIYLQRRFILLIGILLVAGHNLLDNVHVAGDSFSSFLWALLHDRRHFIFGGFDIYVNYPLIPWIGLLAIGYVFGSFYLPGYDPAKRKKIFLFLGISAITLFIILRSGNWYGDFAYWSVQQDFAFSVLSFLNVTKYPPSLLYALMTIGPALIFLSLTEFRLSRLGSKVAVFGRVPMFYYLAHILLIHILATIGAVITGHTFSQMVLTTSVNSQPELKGYGFNLFVVYIVWIALIIMLYPLCRWFDQYKRNHLPVKPWLSYV